MVSITTLLAIHLNISCSERASGTTVFASPTFHQSLGPRAESKSAHIVAAVNNTVSGIVTNWIKFFVYEKMEILGTFPVGRSVDISENNSYSSVKQGSTSMHYSAYERCQRSFVLPKK